MRVNSTLVAPLLATLWLGGATFEVEAQTLPNGVAAGDVDKDRAVLWTRSTQVGDVVFEYSRDRAFIDGVRRRTVTVRDPLLPVKCEIGSLRAGTTWFYRVVDAAGATASGTFRTPHRVGQHHGLRFGVSGDSRGDLAPFPSVQNATPLQLDFFANLGDTIYADVESPALPGITQAKTLREFRVKHSEIYSERDGLNALADLRGSTAFLVTIDDHEVTNDFAGGAPPASDGRFDQHGSFINETWLYGEGLQAFQEYQPLRDLHYGATGDPRTDFKRKLYRARRFGSDASVFLLDARSFRDTGLAPADPTDPADVIRFLVESFDPARTMLGAVQVGELLHDLEEAQRAGVTWKFVMVPEPIQNLGVVAASDRFEGYAAERTELLGFITAQGITNVVFVAADVHGTLVNNLTWQQFPGGPQIDSGSFEVTTGAFAYALPFGPTVVALAHALGFISDAERAYYDSLPLPGKEAFVTALVDAQVLPLGYDALGLEGSTIDATLLEGAWTATHTYGWTEFSIDAASQALTVTTWGLLPDDLGGQPFVANRFVVNPR